MSQQQVAGQTKSWELSLYELHRTPQEVLTDDTVIAISPRSLHSELMCPICLDMLTNTMTTKECLHRFCHDCIITALRAGNKECPTCRKKLISKRSLRHDPNFDSLIAKIYPDREEYEADQEKALEKLHQHTNQQALTASIEEGLRIQTKNRLQRMLKQQRKQQEASTDESQERSPVKDEPNTSNDSADIKLPGSSGTGTPSKKVVKRKQKEKQEAQTERGEVELLLHPHPDSAKIVESRYIKTTGEASVMHLCHFLTTRVSLEQPCDSQPTFRVHTRDADGAYTTLEATVTLFEISQRFAKENSPAELYYSIEPETQES